MSFFSVHVQKVEAQMRQTGPSLVAAGVWGLGVRGWEIEGVEEGRVTVPNK